MAGRARLILDELELRVRRGVALAAGERERDADRDHGRAHHSNSPLPLASGAPSWIHVPINSMSLFDSAWSRGIRSPSTSCMVITVIRYELSTSWLLQGDGSG